MTNPNNQTSNNVTFNFESLTANVTVLDGFALYDDMTAWSLDDKSVNKGLNPDKKCDYVTLRRVDDKGHFDSRNLVSIRFNKSSVQLMFNAKHDVVASLYENLDNVTVNARKKHDKIQLYTVTSSDFVILQAVLCDCCRFENNESPIGIATVKKSRKRKTA